MAEAYLTTEEAAKRLGVTVGRVRQMIIDGTLETQRFGRAHMISEAALKLAEKRKTKRGPEPKPKEHKASGADGKVSVKKSKKEGGKR